MALFTWVIHASVLASILVVFILIIKVLLRDRLGPKWHYYIWFLVLIRLLMPIDLQSPVSIYNYIYTPETASVYYDLSNPREQVSQPQEEMRAGREPEHDMSIPPGTIPGGSESFEAEPFPPETSTSPDFPSIYEIAFYIWLAGVIILILHMALINVRYWNAIRRDKPVKDEGVLQLFEESKERLGIKKRIPLVQTDIVNTTTLYGFIQPRLLLPSNINEKLSLDELRFIFYHELSHIKQKDIAINFASGVLQIFHWFNPVLWYGFFRIRQDREVACDALALSFLHPKEYKKYGKVIIDLIESYSSPVQLPGMIGIVNDGSNIKKRIAMISVFKKNTYKLSITAIVLLLIFGVVFLTSAGEDVVVEGSGNTVGNLVNGGFFAQEGDWMFFSNFEDEGRLYKKRMDGNGTTLLSPDPWVKNINVLDGWVYYVAFEDDSRLYRVKADGSRREPLNEQNSSSVTVIDDTIYYASLQQEHDIDSRELHIYSMALDGSNQRFITTLSPDSSVIIHAGWVYYTDFNSRTGLHNLYRIGVNGEPRVLFSDRAGSVMNMNIVDDWVYYSNDEGIHRISIAGESYAQITRDRAGSLNVAGNWIYYIRGDEEGRQYLYGTGEDGSIQRIFLYDEKQGGNLYRIRINGSEHSQVTNENVQNIHILQNWAIYYSVDEDKFNYIYIDDLEEIPVAKPEEPRGNTTGNIANGGLVAYSEGWIYYSNREDQGKLYKKREDGSDATLLSNNRAVEINVVGDWVYYNNGNLSNRWGNIYKIRTDGTQEILLNEQDSSWVQVVGDWIYYIGFDMENNKTSLYKMKTDGSDQRMIVDSVVSSFQVYGDFDQNRLGKPFPAIP